MFSCSCTGYQLTMHCSGVLLSCFAAAAWSQLSSVTRRSPSQTAPSNNCCRSSLRDARPTQLSGTTPSNGSHAKPRSAVLSGGCLHHYHPCTGPHQRRWIAAASTAMALWSVGCWWRLDQGIGLLQRYGCPNTASKVPAILFPSGHSANSFREPMAQLIAANLCRRGFAVLLLLDVLQQVPQIDPRRLGVAGCSGGGVQAAYISAMDDRVSAASIACYESTLTVDYAPTSAGGGGGPAEGEQQWEPFTRQTGPACCSCT